jgi:predicted dehydrogenase
MEDRRVVRQVGVGIVGAGHISGAYLNALKNFDIVAVRGIADISPQASQKRSAEYGIAQLSIEELLSDPQIEIVLNLTIPKAHLEVGLKSLAAGKHVYSEKPLGITVDEGRKLLEAASIRHLRVGCAPDTFLGGGHQAARRILDSGELGQIVGGTAFCASPGHEYWHPNPEFYYDVGGGPMLDMGPVLYHRSRKSARAR